MPHRRPTPTPARVSTALFTLAWSIPLLLPGDTFAFYPPTFTSLFGHDWVLGLIMLALFVAQHAKLAYRRVPWVTTIIGSLVAFVVWSMISLLIIFWHPASPGGWIYMVIAVLQARLYSESVNERENRRLQAEVWK